MSDITSRRSAALANRCRLARELGAGGMATVYHAEDSKHERQVAIKAVRPELAAEEARPLYGPGDLQFRIWMKRPESVRR